MPTFYWKMNIITYKGKNKKLSIKENAETNLDASRSITNKIIMISRQGIPRFYINGNYICLSHSNDPRMNNYDYIEVEIEIYHKLSVQIPEMIIPEIVKKQGLNINAKPFLPHY
jgi:hypothetical protein